MYVLYILGTSFERFAQVQLVNFFSVVGGWQYTIGLTKGRDNTESYKFPDSIQAGEIQYHVMEIFRGRKFLLFFTACLSGYTAHARDP